MTTNTTPLQREKETNTMTPQTALTDAHIALAAALSVAVPDMIAGDALEKAPGMIDHLQAQGFRVVPIARDSGDRFPDPTRVGW